MIAMIFFFFNKHKYVALYVAVFTAQQCRKMTISQRSKMQKRVLHNNRTMWENFTAQFVLVIFIAVLFVYCAIFVNSVWYFCFPHHCKFVTLNTGPSEHVPPTPFFVFFPLGCLLH